MIKANDEIFKGVRGRFVEVCDDVIRRNKLTFAKLSGDLEITQGNFTQMRNNSDRTPTLAVVYFLCSKFNVNANYILTGIGAMYNNESGVGIEDETAITVKKLKLEINNLKGVNEILTDEKSILEKKLTMALKAKTED